MQKPQVGSGAPAAPATRTLKGSGLITVNDLRLNGGSLGQAGTGASIVTGGGALTAGVSNSSPTFGGIVSGLGSLTKLGAGTLRLTADNTYTGPTMVGNGSLLVNGSLAGSAISVTGGTFGGSGTIDGAVTLLPDHNISLTVTGAVGTAYRLWASTNVALTPLTNAWTLLSNGVKDDCPPRQPEAAARCLLYSHLGLVVARRPSGGGRTWCVCPLGGAGPRDVESQSAVRPDRKG
jgi:autotransporter-associated beta strand protein